MKSSVSTRTGTKKTMKTVMMMNAYERAITRCHQQKKKQRDVSRQKNRQAKRGGKKV